MPTVKGLSGTVYTLEDKPLATGGEGYVYVVTSGAVDCVAKIYRRDVGLTQEGLRQKGEKIRAMAQCPQETLDRLGQFTSWPMDALVDESGGILGFTMKRFPRVKDLEILLPMPEFGDFFKRVVIAHNLCDVVEEVHAIGQCIGDCGPRISASIPKAAGCAPSIRIPFTFAMATASIIPAPWVCRSTTRPSCWNT